jgi:ubiquinone/menaquinone biosynthesis C-methylase UbiE
MGRLNEIISFIEHDFSRRTVIEPERRLQKVRDSLADVIKTYNPGVIVKAGVGGGDLLYDLAKTPGSYIVAVEPSTTVISEFMNRHAGDEAAERIHFINGEFNQFPVDYYAADLLVCVDMMDILETGTVVDEFRRALQFDGILFLAGTVLNDEDVEGLYDDFMRSAFPLHNDYYLRDDLKTVMDLNDFKFIKGHLEHFSIDLAELVDYFRAFYGEGTGDPMKLVEQHGGEFAALYKLKGTVMSEPYYISIFMRNKPEKKS